MVKPLVAALALALTGCADLRRDTHYARYQLVGKSAARQCWRGPEYRACLFRSRSGPVDPGGLVYFFHYAQGDELSADRIGLARAFFARYKEHGAAPPLLSVTFGDHWLLASSRGVRQTVLVDDFVDRVMPELEAKAGRPSWRALWGMSMGGYNAAELALRKPAYWRAVVLSCPALVDADPFVTSGGGATVERGRDLWRHRLTGSEQWSRDDPAALAKATAGGPAFLLQPNDSDEFGFLKGAVRLADELGRRAVLETASGGHCIVDAERAADFLATRAPR